MKAARPDRNTVERRAYLDLQNKARRDGRPFAELLALCTLEGFLARVAQSVHAGNLVLKSGLLLAAFDQRRPTRAAQDEVIVATGALWSVQGARRVHVAEQVALLLRLAADTGARRGELDALRLDDLHGRVLHIDRGVSAEVLTTTKTGRSRRVTVGASTAALWWATLNGWQARLPAGQRLGPWLFSTRPDHTERARSDTLGHWFAAFTRRHGHRDACLHRLRHTVATVLVADGQLLQAQQRLGHREASTTLRQYCHALPLNDLEAADHLEALLEGWSAEYAATTRK